MSAFCFVTLLVNTSYQKLQGTRIDPFLSVMYCKLVAHGIFFFNFSTNNTSSNWDSLLNLALNLQKPDTYFTTWPLPIKQSLQDTFWTLRQYSLKTRDNKIHLRKKETFIRVMYICRIFLSGRYLVIKIKESISIKTYTNNSHTDLVSVSLFSCLILL